MAITLRTSDPGFEAAFRALLAAKRESAADVDGVVARIIDDVAERGDAALVEYTNRFDRVSLTAATLRLGPDEIAAGADAAPPDTVAALRVAAERIESLSSPAAAVRHRLRRRRRGAARAALAADRGGRALRAGRHGGLSLVGADERDPGQGRRGRAARDGGAGAGRRAEPAGAGGGASRRDRRDLPGRRGAGDRGAGLRHRDDRAGRQDRRPRQRLCRGGEAAGLRPGRDRHDRRPVGNPGRRRPAQRPGLDRRRPACRRPSTTRRRSRS